MTTLIYYPTFEPQSTNWLKYALIYLDEFSPIIPVRGQDQLSDLFRQVEGETTLIKRIEPSWEQGGRATRKVLREAREIQNYPEEYHAIFNNANIISSWRNQKNWNVRLYQEKFSIPFSEFCQDQNFGINVDGDLYLSEELASFFMTFLAEEIAYEKQATPITDLPNLDELSTYLRSKKIENKDKVQAAKTIIDLHLPQGIEHIDIEKFINFRTESGITELRQSFNKTLQMVYDSLEQNQDPYVYLESIRKTNKEFIQEMLLYFGALTSFGLGGLAVLNNAHTDLEIVAKIFEGSLLQITGGIALNKAWQINKDRRNARKFLSKVRKLNAS